MIRMEEIFKKITRNILALVFCFSSLHVQADSVYDWGFWDSSQENPRAAIGDFLTSEAKTEFTEEDLIDSDSFIQAGSEPVIFSVNTIEAENPQVVTVVSTSPSSIVTTIGDSSGGTFTGVISTTGVIGTGGSISLSAGSTGGGSISTIGTISTTGAIGTGGSISLSAGSTGGGSISTIGTISTTSAIGTGGSISLSAE